MTRFNTTWKSILFLMLFFPPFSLYSQITISEISKKTEEIIVLKPESYDSLQNWKYYDQNEIVKYKKYIGIDIYLPPIPNCKIGLKNYGIMNFLFTRKPSKIKFNYEACLSTYDPRGNDERAYEPENSKTVIPHFVDTIITNVYKPIHYFGLYSTYGGGRWSKLGQSLQAYTCTDSSSVSGNYFTIIDVLYTNRLVALLDSIGYKDSSPISNKIYKSEIKYELGFDHSNAYPMVSFLLKNMKNGDSIYCFNVDKFIIVPYFMKQKALFENKYLIYDKTSQSELFDFQHAVKQEDKTGKEISSFKKVSIESRSKWYCKEVTLMKELFDSGNTSSRQDPNKPLYNIRYILKNDKDEQIVLSDLDNFVEEQSFIIRESNKRLQKEQLIAKIKQEEQIRSENRRRAFENKRAQYINQFGTQIGELLAQGKVKIGMSSEMCGLSWGYPFSSRKTTTVDGKYEHWYYPLGYSLYFANGILIRIDE